MPRLTTILLDLDGTLTDPAEGIVDSCRYALGALGRPAPPGDDLLWVIGPPVRQSFARLLRGRADPELALAPYRERYGAYGLHEASVYHGIPDALAAPRGLGLDLLVCASKARVFAERIVDHFGLGAWFDEVYGAELDGRLENKGDLIAHILEDRQLPAAAACMVGDREHDILAAARHGMASIGVTWGYGGEAELLAAGAPRLIGAPRELPGACAELISRP